MVCTKQPIIYLFNYISLLIIIVGRLGGGSGVCKYISCPLGWCLWSAFGFPWRDFGVHLVPFGVHLAPFGIHLAPFGVYLVPFWVHLDPFGVHLITFWGVPRAIF